MHSITAIYSGNATFATSTSPALAHTVDKARSATALTSSHNPSVFGQPVTLTATVTAVAPGGGTPTGTVTFKSGLTVLSTVALTAGKASLFVASLAVGSHSITADYNGSADYDTSNSAVLTQTVKQAATSTTITSSLNPSTLGQTVTFKVTSPHSRPALARPPAP